MPLIRSDVPKQALLKRFALIYLPIVIVLSIVLLSKTRLEEQMEVERIVGRENNHIEIAKSHVTQNFEMVDSDLRVIALLPIMQRYLDSGNPAHRDELAKLLLVLAKEKRHYDKVRYLVDELGFDGAFNYKMTKNYVEKLKELCPRGIDVYFDNVGGSVTDAVIPLLNQHARLAICGQISQYNLEKPETSPRWLWALIVKQARAEGFLVFQFADRFAEGARAMAAWIQEGRLQFKEDVVEGFDSLPQAFIGMLQGDNTGKRVVKVS